jgi:hypothetical protein
VLRAAGLAVVALVQAEEDVVLVIAQGGPSYSLAAVRRTRGGL